MSCSRNTASQKNFLDFMTNKYEQRQRELQRKEAELKNRLRNLEGELGNNQGDCDCANETIKDKPSVVQTFMTNVSNFLCNCSTDDFTPIKLSKASCCSTSGQTSASISSGRKNFQIINGRKVPMVSDERECVLCSHTSSKSSRPASGSQCTARSGGCNCPSIRDTPSGGKGDTRCSSASSKVQPMGCSPGVSSKAQAGFSSDACECTPAPHQAFDRCSCEPCVSAVGGGKAQPKSTSIASKPVKTAMRSAEDTCECTPTLQGVDTCTCEPCAKGELPVATAGYKRGTVAEPKGPQHKKPLEHVEGDRCGCVALARQQCTCDACMMGDREVLTCECAPSVFNIPQQVCHCASCVRIGDNEIRIAKAGCDCVPYGNLGFPRVPGTKKLICTCQECFTSEDEVIEEKVSDEGILDPCECTPVIKKRNRIIRDAKYEPCSCDECEKDNFRAPTEYDIRMCWFGRGVRLRTGQACECSPLVYPEGKLKPSVAKCTCVDCHRMGEVPQKEDIMSMIAQTLANKACECEPYLPGITAQFAKRSGNCVCNNCVIKDPPSDGAKKYKRKLLPKEYECDCLGECDSVPCTALPVTTTKTGTQTQDDDICACGADCKCEVCHKHTKTASKRPNEMCDCDFCKCAPCGNKATLPECGNVGCICNPCGDVCECAAKCTCRDCPNMGNKRCDCEAKCLCSPCPKTMKPAGGIGDCRSTISEEIFSDALDRHICSANVGVGGSCQCPGTCTCEGKRIAPSRRAATKPSVSKSRDICDCIGPCLCRPCKKKPKIKETSSCTSRSTKASKVSKTAPRKSAIASKASRASCVSKASKVTIASRASKSSCGSKSSKTSCASKTSKKSCTSKTSKRSATSKASNASCKSKASKSSLKSKSSKASCGSKASKVSTTSGASKSSKGSCRSKASKSTKGSCGSKTSLASKTSKSSCCSKPSKSSVASSAASCGTKSTAASKSTKPSYDVKSKGSKSSCCSTQSKSTAATKTTKPSFDARPSKSSLASKASKASCTSKASKVTIVTDGSKGSCGSQPSKTSKSSAASKISKSTRSSGTSRCSCSSRATQSTRTSVSVKSSKATTKKTCNCDGPCDCDTCSTGTSRASSVGNTCDCIGQCVCTPCEKAPKDVCECDPPCDCVECENAKIKETTSATSRGSKASRASKTSSRASKTSSRASKPSKEICPCEGKCSCMTCNKDMKPSQIQDPSKLKGEICGCYGTCTCLPCSTPTSTKPSISLGTGDECTCQPRCTCTPCSKKPSKFEPAAARDSNVCYCVGKCVCAPCMKSNPKTGPVLGDYNCDCLGNCICQTCDAGPQLPPPESDECRCVGVCTCVPCGEKTPTEDECACEDDEFVDAVQGKSEHCDCAAGPSISSRTSRATRDRSCGDDDSVGSLESRDVERMKHLMDLYYLDKKMKQQIQQLENKERSYRTQLSSKGGSMAASLQKENAQLKQQIEAIKTNLKNFKGGGMKDKCECNDLQIELTNVSQHIEAVQKSYFRLMSMLKKQLDTMCSKTCQVGLTKCEDGSKDKSKSVQLHFKNSGFKSEEKSCCTPSVKDASNVCFCPSEDGKPDKADSLIALTRELSDTLRKANDSCYCDMPDILSTAKAIKDLADKVQLLNLPPGARNQFASGPPPKRSDFGTTCNKSIPSTGKSITSGNFQGKQSCKATKAKMDDMKQIKELGCKIMELPDKCSSCDLLKKQQCVCQEEIQQCECPEPGDNCCHTACDRCCMSKDPATTQMCASKKNYSNMAADHLPRPDVVTIKPNAVNVKVANMGDMGGCQGCNG